jgi:peptide/nickel transport system ATP-binding protein
MGETLLEIRELRTCFEVEGRRSWAVDGVSLAVRAGETLCVVGESGCGKSVTALSVLRLIPSPPGRVAGGEIIFEGRDLLKLTEREIRAIRGNRISMVFQEPMTSLNPVFRIGEQIIESIRVHQGARPAAARARALELLDQVGMPSPEQRLDEFPHQLSGGMKQRAMIAMALASRPRLLIADEPTTALDVTIQAQILDLLQRLQREYGMAVILITHDLGVVAEIADRVAVLYAGKVVETCSTEALFAQPLHPYTAGLFASLPQLDGRSGRLRAIPGEVPDPSAFPAGCRFHPRCAAAQAGCRGELPVLVEAAAGRWSSCARIEAGRLPPEIERVEVSAEIGGGAGRSARAPEPGGAAAAPLVQVEGLVTHFPIRRGFFGRIAHRVHAVDGVSFEIGPGETLGLVGESGCGKTTVGRSLLRLVPATAGRVLYRGRDLLSLPPAELRRQRRELQIIFQDPYGSLDPRMTVESIVGEGLAVHELAGGSARRERVREIIQRVGLDPSMHLGRYPHEFSGGQRQRIGIARALAVEPRFVVCDEAVSALDVSIQAQIINLLRDLQEERGLSYLFIAHDLSVVRHLSHRVAVMYLGRLVETGRVEDIYRRPHHPYTRALLDAVPVTDPARRGARKLLGGDVPSPIDPPRGCRFAPRCPKVMDRCRVEDPPARAVGDGQVSWCFLEA